MADEPVPQGTNPDDNAEPPKPTPPAREEPDWKAEARKHESREKEWKAKAEANQAAADRLKQIEENAKSDLEKAIARAEAAEAKVAKYEQQKQIAAWAEEITKDSQVPASALRGSTRDELQAHFEHLSQLIPAPAQETPPPQGQPVSTIGQQPEVARNVPIAEQIATAEAAGDKALVARLKAMQLGAVKTT